MTIKELAEYCQNTECDNCNYTEECAKFKRYLQDYICPATLLIKGCEGIIEPNRKFYPNSPL